MWKVLETTEQVGLWVFVILVLLLHGLGCGSCPKLVDPYRAYLAQVTDHKIPPCDQWTKTPKTTPFWAPSRYATDQMKQLVDTKVDALESCLLQAGVLSLPIRRSGFAVMVAPDWYVSTCTGEQMIPSRADYRLCEQKKNPDGTPVKIPEECRGLTHPTASCPCPCNFRVAVLRSNIIVVTPNLKLFKPELARVVLYPNYNNPWTDAKVAACVAP